MRGLAYAVAAVAAVGIMISIAQLPKQDAATSTTAEVTAEATPANLMAEAGTLTLSVPSMHCEFACYPRVKEAIEKVDGVQVVELAEQKEEGVLDNRQVVVQYDAGFNLDTALAMLAEEGYDDSSVVQ